MARPDRVCILTWLGAIAFSALAYYAVFHALMQWTRMG